MTIKLSGLCYLASPYSSHYPELVEQRMHQVSRCQAALIKRGLLVVTPLSAHYLLKYESLPGDWAFWKNYGEALLRACENLIVLPLPGWEVSTGVTAEIALAQKLGIARYFCNLDNFELSELDFHSINTGC